MRASTLNERRRLYLLARVVIARHYRRELTLATVARALCCSSRQLQRAYAQFGKSTFHEDLVTRRMAVAAELLAEQTISIREVARQVGYCHAPHFAAAFRRRYGLSPTGFRAQERRRSELAGSARV